MTVTATASPVAPPRPQAVVHAARHTKIVCTLGPATATVEKVNARVAAGMDVATLTFSHGEPADTGFGLARALSDAGMDCVVAAPSKLQRPAGHRVKTPVMRRIWPGCCAWVRSPRMPDREIEAVRDLVRAREDARADLMRVRHRLSKLLLRQGIIYSSGHPWTGIDELWLRRQRFDDVHPAAAAFDHYFDAVLCATAAPDRLDEQIAVVAASPRFADQVDRLGCLRGVSALTGLALSVEIGDWSRFTGLTTQLTDTGAWPPNAITTVTRTISRR